MTAQYLGTQTYGGSIQSVYRLSRPLVDAGPDSRVVVLTGVSALDGGQWLTRGRAYEGADGVWKAVPAVHGSWIRCFAGLSARDEAFARSEIRAAHGNWSA